MDSRPVGRDAEIAEICAFLSATSGASAALAITGDAGIGKTAVWTHVVQAAGRSSRVLSCRPASAERPLAFSALDDLFGDVIEEVLPALPGPRRRAVEAALLRDASPGFPSAGHGEAGRRAPERRVLACGGNPFYALECARALIERPGMSFTSEPIPIPQSLSDLVRRPQHPRQRSAGTLLLEGSIREGR